MIPSSWTQPSTTPLCLKLDVDDYLCIQTIRSETSQKTDFIVLIIITSVIINLFADLNPRKGLLCQQVSDFS